MVYSPADICEAEQRAESQRPEHIQKHETQVQDYNFSNNNNKNTRTNVTDVTFS